MNQKVRYAKQIGNELYIGYEDGSYQLFQIRERDWNKDGSLSSVLWYPTDKIFNKKEGE